MNDLDDLSLPPRRPLPRDVRDRLRATVLRQPHTRPTSNRMALVVAAGVAVLAMGATVLTQVIAGSHGVSPAEKATSGTRPALDVVAAKADMSRCWSALAKTSSVGAVPAEADWEAVLAETWDGVTVTAMRAAGEPLFCETTRTTVTVSNPKAQPAYAAGSRTGALLASPQGVVAGVIDPTWQIAEVVGTGTSGAQSSGPIYGKDGMFIMFTSVVGPGTRYTVRQPKPGTKPLDLPAAPEPLVALVDRPDPPADRTSPAGQVLRDCIAHTDFAVPDPDSWQPVAMTTTGTTVVLASSASSTAVCSVVDQQASNSRTPVDFVFHLTGTLASTKPLAIMYDAVVTSVSPAEGWVALGMVRPDVASVQIVAPTGQTMPVELSKGVFTAQYAIPDDTHPWRQVTVVLRDKTGRELYHAPVPVGP